MLDLNEPIHLVDGEYQCMQHSAPFVRLRKMSDGSIIDMHVTELARKVVGLLPKLPVAPRELESFPDKDRKTAMLLAAHLHELLTGVRPDSETVRAEYDPRVHSQEKRIACKVEELQRLGIRASRSTLMRDLKELREEGTSGLIDKRKTQRTSAPLANLDARIKDCLCTVIARAGKKSTHTKSYLIQETYTEHLKRYGCQPDVRPSIPSMYRYIHILTKGKHTTKSAKTRQSLANRPDRTFTKPMPALPGETAQIDSTKLDVLVLTPSGEMVRPTLTIMVDIATRSILASSIRLEAKGVDHALLLAQCLTPAQNRPDKSLFREALRLQNPDLNLLDDVERRQLEMTRPHIRPRSIMTDLGKDFTSDVFLAALERNNIDAPQSAPHTPTDKAIVERTFGSINTLFTQFQPGYTGRSPEHRGYEVEKDKLLTIHALYERFDDWVLNVWQNRPHSGLRDLMNPATTYSPNQAYLAWSELTTTLYIPLKPEDYIELLPRVYRVISATGIKHENREYDSPELHPYRDTKSSIPSENGKFQVKYDPYNPFAVWVRPNDSAWIECLLRNRGELLNPHAEDILSGRLKDKADIAITNASITGTPMHEPQLELDEPAEQTDEHTPSATEASFGEFNYEQD